MVALDLLLFAYTLARKYYVPKLLFSELFSPKNYFTTKALFGYQIPPRHISRIRFFLSEAGNAILFFRFLLLGDPGLPFFGYIFVYSSDWFSSLIFLAASSWKQEMLSFFWVSSFVTVAKGENIL